ncbi:lysozyme inhibitor LprI family protein [Mesorhizobium xinjiangense]|uniref:lysozyme inhibitor LprI family protein n=1 Tax=Mesorhizobium xinjiangense TaxID=2678685 RepID=UPI0012EE32F7|nr:lysozyme inhibitor LprI family protein [Mesorhizobium xinjiangense]
MTVKTRNVSRGAGLLALMLVAGPAAGDAIYDGCIDKSDGTNAAWAQCGGDWLKREDKKLNATWKTTFAATDGQTKKDILAEQRLWIAYKESACSFYANGDWGREGQVLDYAACRAGVIAARTKELQAYGDFFQGR